MSVGTTGESATLPFDEHINVVKKLLLWHREQFRLLPAVAQTLRRAIFLTEQLGSTGIDGFLSVVPYYNKPQQAGMVAHFNAIADASDLPVILYNVPGRTVADMLPETVAKLATHRNIVGLKDATGNIARLKATQPLVPDDFVLLSGDDGSSCEFMVKAVMALSP